MEMKSLIKRFCKCGKPAANFLSHKDQDGVTKTAWYCDEHWIWGDTLNELAALEKLDRSKTPDS